MSIVSTIGPNGKRVEAEAEVGDVDRVLESLEAGKTVRKRVTAEKKAVDAATVAKKVEKKVKKVAKTVEAVETATEAVEKPKRGKLKNNPNRTRALEIIRALKEQGVTEQKVLIKAIMEDLGLEKKQQAVAWYYVNKVYKD
jgi:predicted transcriptional regulator YheO